PLPPATVLPGSRGSAARGSFQGACAIPHRGRRETPVRSVHRVGKEEKTAGHALRARGVAPETAALAGRDDEQRHVASMATLQDGEWWLPFGKTAETSLETRPRRVAYRP